MPDYVALVIFGIQAAIKLGDKVQTVFEDETRDRELILPEVEHTDLPNFVNTKAFFEGEGKLFVQEPNPMDSPGASSVSLGLYHSLWLRRDETNEIREKLSQAYQRILGYSSSDADLQRQFKREPKTFYEGTNALFVVKQWRDGTDPKRHPIQRIGGTIIEIALDYVKADPTLFGGTGNGERITRAFLLSLEPLDLAETKADELLLQIFESSLNVLRNQADLIISEDHLALLLKRITVTLSGYVKQAEDSGDADKLRALFTFRREILQEVIKTSAATVAEHSAEFFGATSTSRDRKLLDGVLQAVLGAAQDQSDLFSGQALAHIFAAALNGVAQNASLIWPESDTNGRDAFLRTLFTRVAEQLAASAKTDPPGIFSPDLLHNIIAAAIEITADNVPRLIDPKDPERQLLADALQEVLRGFSPALHQDTSLPRTLKALFTRDQLMLIVREVFSAVARNPEALLHGVTDDHQRTALAQIVGAVATAISSDSRRLVNGQGYVQLLNVALEAFAKNPDRLLDLDQTDPRQQLLTKVIVSVVSATTKSLEAGGRDLLTGSTLVRMIGAAITAVSANVDGFRRDPDIVTMVMDRILRSASGPLKNDLDGEMLVQLVGPLLRRAVVDRTALTVSDADLILANTP